MTSLLRKLAWFIRRPRFEQEMTEEMAAHIEQEVADRVAHGADPAEAWRTARRDFGRVAAIKEDAREARGAPRLEIAARDLRWTVRGLVRTPGAALVATITFALAIGAMTTVGSVIDRLLLSPLPYPAPERLAVAWEQPARTNRGNVVSIPNFEAWQQRARSFTDLAGLVPDQLDLELTRPERIAGAAVSASWFQIVGVAPALGRGFSDAEATGDAAVIVLSHALWHDHFGADPAIVGRTVRFSGQRRLVLGVMPPDFEPPAFGWLGSDQRYWVPFAPNPANRQWGRFLLVLGRLRPGISPAAANAELVTVASALAREDPRNRTWTAQVRGLAAEVAGDVRPPLIALGIAAMALVLASGANLATTLLARARRRREELAVRLTLGGSRHRVAGPLVLEAMLIAGAALPAGLTLGHAAVRILAGTQIDLLPRAATLFVSGRLILVIALITAALALVAGAAAASAVPAGDARHWLNARGLGAGSTRTLIGAEVAAAVLLTLIASLAGRSFLALRDVRLGFSPERVTAFRISLPPERYATPAARIFFADLARKIRVIPGVTAVGLIDYRPYHAAGQASQVGRLGEPIDPATAPVVDVRTTDSAYFETLGIARRRRPVPGFVDGVIISQGLAELLWPGAESVGRRIQIARADTVTVAGVVDDVRLHGPRLAVRGTIYRPIEGHAIAEGDVMVRAGMPLDALAKQVRNAVESMDPAIPVHGIEPLEHLVAAAVAGDRVTSLTLTAFSLISLLLAAGGITSVLLVELSARRRELGVRMALGATPGRVGLGVAATGLRMLIPGLVIGGVAAALLVPVIRHSVPGVSPSDPGPYLAGARSFGTPPPNGLAGPVRRAIALDPVKILRGD